MIDKFDLVIRLNDSPNIISKNKKLGTRTDILYHNLYLKENPVINEELLISQNKQFVLYNLNAPHLEFNFYNSKIKFKSLKIFKVHPFYYSFLIKKYCKSNSSPTTGILAINHLIRQKFKELHIVGFTFYSTQYVNGYKGVEISNSGLGIPPTSLGKTIHNPKLDFESFFNIYTKFHRFKNIKLDSNLKLMIFNHLSHLSQ